MATNRLKSPVESANAIKKNTASYLRQYWQHQWLAASRGLLPGIDPNSSDAPPNSSFAPGELDDDDKMLLARLDTTKNALERCFSQLDEYLRRLETSLLATRARLWVGSVVGVLLASFVLLLAFPPKFNQNQRIQGSARSFIPLLPSPITLYLVASRERSIRRTRISIARLNHIRESVALSTFVPSENISWLRRDTWDGVDWDRVGL
ncbi:hypothetical protein TWF569_003925 [Orbilia oligospora]|uniref:Uncharacterized protein n=1 Tax=Orbilia oligospora TaxID=2813651 RepID=A0A7C8J7D0_ORBOL|nr:hypothetical protein TWF102_005372 [Orbilia oligospora]KAF3114150.1 hypothetical protein TWF103_001572 [Orbilia oligospora]KAF3157005.1 hypothetical protein TWF569_003925 [Orbilia oligospora]